MKPVSGSKAAVALAVLIVALSWTTLFVRVAGPGLEIGVKDQRHYLASAKSLFERGELVMPLYRLDLDRTVDDPLTSFPPLTSWTLALLLYLGVPIETAPTVMALVAWPLFLLLIGALARRLADGEAAAALFAMAFAAITWPYLNVFTEVQSEILFIPLLVAAVLAVDGLLAAPRVSHRRLALVASISSLLVLSRYTGFFYLVALGGWWIFVRLKKSQARSLVHELAWLAVPALTLGGWLLRNVFLVDNPVGPILLSETLPAVSGTDVLRSFAVQGTWLVLPAARPGAVWRTFGWLGISALALVVLVGVTLLLRHHRAGLTATFERSPLVAFLALYLLFLLVAPSFMRMQGMIERYMAVVLCLAQPWLVARLVTTVPRRPGQTYLGLFLALNLALVAVFTLGGGIVGAADLGGQPQVQTRRLMAGTPAWWVHRPPRMKDLANHHPDVVRQLATLPAETVIVSNAPALFAWSPLLVGEEPVSLWIERGTCATATPLAVVVLDWDRWSEEVAPELGLPPPSELISGVREKCPQARAEQVRHGTIYMLATEGEDVQPKDERTIQDQASERYERVRYASPGSRRYHDWWLDQMLAKADGEQLAGDVLDNGCGVGVLLTRLGDARRACGSDLSYGMLRHARDGGRAGVVQADSVRLPFADASFDLVFARALLHHLPQPDDGLAEIARVLRPGGLAVLADTNRSLLSSLPRAIAYRGEKFSDDHRNFHRSEYLAAVRRHLEVVDVQFFGYLAYPFGFPDVSPLVRRLEPPRRLLDALIRVDAGIARIPGLRTQSWGLIVSARRPS